MNELVFLLGVYGFFITSLDDAQVLLHLHHKNPQRYSSTIIGTLLGLLVVIGISWGVKEGLTAFIDMKSFESISKVMMVGAMGWVCYGILGDFFEEKLRLRIIFIFILSSIFSLSIIRHGGDVQVIALVVLVFVGLIWLLQKFESLLSPNQDEVYSPFWPACFTYIINGSDDIIVYSNFMLKYTLTEQVLYSLGVIVGLFLLAQLIHIVGKKILAQEEDVQNKVRVISGLTALAYMIAIAI